MQHVRLGRSALRVSRLALGTANFGWLVPEAEAHALLDAAVEAGVNLIDTADSYGGQRGEGLAERIIGSWLRADPARRDRVVLATKGFAELSDAPNDRGLSAYHLRRAVEGSLQRLGTAHLDLYQLHHVDPEVTGEEIWEALGRAIDAGQITYAGTSNFAAWQLARLDVLGTTRGRLGLVAEQSVYHLAQRAVELELLPACRGLGLGFLAYAPLAGGALAAPAAGSQGRRAEAHTVEVARRHQRRIQAFHVLAARAGYDPAELALAWVLGRRGVTSVVLGPRTLGQLQAGLRAATLRLEPELLEALDRIFPGPGGEAPEAYAW